eukprot:Cvel_28316.t1-p1 / transcript=Cvel_28316.t1 / gene=Cvel_28316 / organism=Chromera_velia_CCMP2878 / gene_product=hypothetical protein / transcript_product=hypothetical protein / location=Cvel_scaffold3678:12990-14632(+) / protein_length=425 / sequence_SO=supercontig / SO=protein_coding / is_pseudo=false
MAPRPCRSACPSGRSRAKTELREKPPTPGPLLDLETEPLSEQRTQIARDEAPVATALVDHLLSHTRRDKQSASHTYLEHPLKDDNKALGREAGKLVCRAVQLEGAAETGGNGGHGFGGSLQRNSLGRVSVPSLDLSSLKYDSFFSRVYGRDRVGSAFPQGYQSNRFLPPPAPSNPGHFLYPPPLDSPVPPATSGAPTGGRDGETTDFRVSSSAAIRVATVSAATTVRRPLSGTCTGRASAAAVSEGVCGTKRTDVPLSPSACSNMNKGGFASLLSAGIVGTKLHAAPPSPAESDAEAEEKKRKGGDKGKQASGSDQPRTSPARLEVQVPSHRQTPRDPGVPPSAPPSSVATTGRLPPATVLQHEIVPDVRAQHNVSLVMSGSLELLPFGSQGPELLHNASTGIGEEKKDKHKNKKRHRPTSAKAP